MLINILIKTFFFRCCRFVVPVSVFAAQTGIDPNITWGGWDFLLHPFPFCVLLLCHISTPICHSLLCLHFFAHSLYISVSHMHTLIHSVICARCHSLKHFSIWSHPSVCFCPPSWLPSSICYHFIHFFTLPSLYFSLSVSLAHFPFLYCPYSLLSFPAFPV